MEEKLKYEIKISVYESGRSRMERVKNGDPAQIRDILLKQAEAIFVAMIKAEIMKMLMPVPNLPSAADIMRTKQ